ncbi:hypothetical protein Angca_000088, partial [Angiostrongylus cantonensis]
MGSKSSPYYQGKVCAGCLRQEIIVRTSSRGSIRETLAKAIRSTFRRCTTENSHHGVFPHTNNERSSVPRHFIQNQTVPDRQPSLNVLSQSLIHPETCELHESCPILSLASLTALKDINVDDFDDVASTVS